MWMKAIRQQKGLEKVSLCGHWDGLGHSICDLRRGSLPFVLGAQVRNSLPRSSRCAWSFEADNSEKKLNRNMLMCTAWITNRAPIW